MAYPPPGYPGGYPPPGYPAAYVHLSPPAVLERAHRHPLSYPPGYVAPAPVVYGAPPPMYAAPPPMVYGAPGYPPPMYGHGGYKHQKKARPRRALLTTALSPLTSRTNAHLSR